jgi:hypothetical protein
MTTISNAKIRQDLSQEHTLEPNASNKDGNSFPLAFAKVLRVDPRKRVVDLISLTGQSAVYRDVLIPFAAGGARHFLGALPEPADIAVIGYTHEESGHSRSPLIVAWVIPGVTKGYDWLLTQFTAQEALAMTPEVQENLKGIVGRRRHKSMLLESGNVAASSAQGADMLLDESVTLANRRGNEIVLRDQDQALVVRSLQQFHAGAGFRVYGGMVQRDAAFLPTQMISDGILWDAERQVDANGVPLEPSMLENMDSGSLEVNKVFINLPNIPNHVDPREVLKRGLFIDQENNVYDDKVVPEVVYGGKPYHRVTQGPTGQTYSEYRIEVAHTTDGTLPVSEQTDGLDIDRLLPNTPLNDEAIDATNRSPNAPMVEFVLGTAIGNDPTGDRGSYARPLKPQVFTKDGQVSASIVPAEDDDPETDHAAFLVRVKNPVDLKAPDAFMAITKGGVFKSYFPGKGSKSNQEYHAVGREMRLGTDEDGQSLTVRGDGTVSLLNIARPRVTDNVGVDISSDTGAVTIVGGGAETGGPDAGVFGVRVTSAAGIKLNATTLANIQAPDILFDNAQNISSVANQSLSLNSAGTTSVNTGDLNVAVSGKANYAYGGGAFSLNASRTTTFTANPATGAIGGAVDQWAAAFGGLSSYIGFGRYDFAVSLGSFNVSTHTAIDLASGATSLNLDGAPDNAFDPAGAADGIRLISGPFPGSQSGIEIASPLGFGKIKVQSNLGDISIIADTGEIEQRALRNVQATSLLGSITLSAPVGSLFVNVRTVNTGAVITDGVIDAFTGKRFNTIGTLGVTNFLVY